MILVVTASDVHVWKIIVVTKGSICGACYCVSTLCGKTVRVAAVLASALRNCRYNCIMEKEKHVGRHREKRDRKRKILRQRKRDTEIKREKETKRVRERERETEKAREKENEIERERERETETER